MIHFTARENCVQGRSLIRTHSYKELRLALSEIPVRQLCNIYLRSGWGARNIHGIKFMWLDLKCDLTPLSRFIKLQLMDCEESWFHMKWDLWQRVNGSGYIEGSNGTDALPILYSRWQHTVGKLFCKARMTAEMSSVMQPQGNEWSQQTVEEQMGQKMSSESLTRSEVFGQLRRELYGEERSSHSNTHLFIILGASVSTALKTALSCSIWWNVSFNVVTGLVVAPYSKHMAVSEVTGWFEEIKTCIKRIHILLQCGDPNESQVWAHAVWNVLHLLFPLFSNNRSWWFSSENIFTVFGFEPGTEYQLHVYRSWMFF